MTISKTMLLAVSIEDLKEMIAETAAALETVDGYCRELRQEILAADQGDVPYLQGRLIDQQHKSFHVERTLNELQEALEKRESTNTRKV